MSRGPSGNSGISVSGLKPVATALWAPHEGDFGARVTLPPETAGETRAARTGGVGDAG